MKRFALVGIALGVFALGYLVCRVADWVVYSDEERIADRITAMAGAARARDYRRLLTFVRLEDFGLIASGYGERYSFGPGDGDKVVDRAAGAGAMVPVESLRVVVDEDDVHVDGGRARVKATLVFRQGEHRYRQPVRSVFRKSGDEWFLTEFEFLGADQLFRP